jgi:GntR family transcriptional regulator, rspAB operon transcriptional repressor
MNGPKNPVLRVAADSGTTPDASEIVSVNSRIYNLVKERICSNRFKAGTKLNHQELAELFNVSRTPIREALERLYQEGFITHYPNRGFFVAQIDEEEARQLFELREGLELHAFRISVEHGGKFDLRRMRAINVDYHAAVKGPQVHRRMSLDRDFHLALAAHCRNGFLLKSLEGIFERIMLKLRVDSYPTLPSKAYGEHVQLLQAIAAKDFPSASALLSTHIRAGFDRLLGQLDERP